MRDEIGEYEWVYCRECGGTGDPRFRGTGEPRCIFCDGTGEVKSYYMYDDYEDRAWLAGMPARNWK